MSTRLADHLRALRDAGRKGVIPYVTAGDPNLEVTGEIVRALARAGAAAIEIGVPFSDPIADGPTIQAASQRALAAGATLDGVLRMCAAVKDEIDCPLILFSYLNPMSRMGYAALAARLPESGVDAVLATDATPGVEPELEEALAAHGLDRIVLVAPTTPVERLPMLAGAGSGFLYVIARRGVTGRGGEQSEIPTHVDALREVTDLPIYVGFGVRSRADGERIWAFADGVIVGSALVDALHAEPDPGARPGVAEAFLRAIVEG